MRGSNSPEARLGFHVKINRERRKKVKLVKNKYYTSKGEPKLNNYMVYIRKSLVEQSDIDPEKDIQVYVEDGKIVIDNVQ